MKGKIEKLGFILSSPYRTAMVKLMDDRIFIGAMFWRIVRQKLPKMDRSEYYKCLSDMVREGVLECINPEEKYGKVYKLTPRGARIRNYIIHKNWGGHDVSDNLR